MTSERLEATGADVAGVAGVAMGTGMVLMALFPLAIPILILTAVAVAPLALLGLVPMLLAGIVAGVLVAIRAGARKLTRGGRRREHLRTAEVAR